MSVENTATEATTTTTEEKPVVAETTADTEENLLGDVEGQDDGKQADDAAAKDGADDEDNSDDLLEGKIGEDEKDAAADAEQEDYDLTPPEGYELDADLAESFKPVAKELKLSKDQAQGLVEKFGPELMTQIAQKQAAAWKDIQQKWAKEAKADPEFGGKNLEKSLADVARARDFFGPEFTATIKLLGGNNNPSVLKALAKVGVALGEDTPGFGKPASAQTSVEQRLYPNDQPNNKEN